MLQRGRDPCWGSWMQPPWGLHKFIHFDIGDRIYVYIYFTVNQFFLATVHHSSILFYSNHHSSIDRNHQNHHLTMIGKSIFLSSLSWHSHILICHLESRILGRIFNVPSALESNMAMGNSPLIPWNFPFKAPFFFGYFPASHVWAPEGKAMI